MRRVTTISFVVMMMLLVALLVTVTSSTAWSAPADPDEVVPVTLAPTPAPTPPPVPIQPLPGEENQPGLVDRAGGFLAGLKRFAENVWNILTNREKRGSSILDLLAMGLGGGSGGLEELVRKFVEANFLIPKFSGDEIWAVFSAALFQLVIQLVALTAPIYFLLRVLGLSRRSLVNFTIGWFLMVFIVTSDRLMWEFGSLLFRFFILQIGGGPEAVTQISQNLRDVADGLFLLLEGGNPAVLYLAFLSMIATLTILWVVLFRFSLAAWHLIIIQGLTGLRIWWDATFRNSAAMLEWLLTAVGLFVELALYPILGLFAGLPLLAAIANDWGVLLLVAIPAVPFGLIFAPAWIVHEMFRRIAEKAVERGKPEALGRLPGAPPSLAERREEAAQRLGQVRRRTAALAAGLIAVGVDAYQAAQIAALQAQQAEEAGVDRAQEAAIRELGSVPPPKSGSPPTPSQPPTAAGGSQPVRGDSPQPPKGGKVAAAPPSTGQVGVAPAKPATTGQPSEAATVAKPGRAAIQAAGLKTAEQLLKRQGYKVAPKTLAAAVPAATGAVKTAVGAISAPAAGTAAVLGGILLAEGGALWFLANQISGHRKRWQRIGDYIHLSVEAGVEAERQARERRLAAARVRWPRGGER